MTLSNEQKPDLSEMFDLNRHKAVNNYVDRFEELLREKLAALRRISNAVKVDLFSWADKHRETQ